MADALPTMPADEQSPVPRAPLALSPTKLADFACPHRYKTIHVEGQRDGADTPVPLLMGQLAHEVAAAYLWELNRTGRETWHERLKKIALAYWLERDDRIPEEMVDDHLAFVEHLQGFSVKPEQIDGVERTIAFNDRFEEVDWDDAFVAYGGKLDLLLRLGKDHLGVVDWTTASITGTLGAKKDLQLRFYGLLASLAYGVEHVTVEMQSLRTGAERMVDLFRDDHERTVQRIATERARVTKKVDDPEADWPAVPGSLCGICRLDCPYEAQTGSVARLTSEDEARRVHEELILVEEQRKAKLRLLNTWVGVNGPLTTNGVRAEIRPHARHDWDSSGLLAHLEAQGFSRSEAMSVFTGVDRRRLRKLITDQAGREDAEAFATAKVGEKFYPLGRVGAEDSE